MKLDKAFKIFIKKLGFDIKIKKFPYGEIKRRINLLRYHEIDVILDVGANTGQFGQMMRMAGYRKKIISFEPLSSAFEKLESRTQKDQDWQAYRYAIGREDKTSIINISKNSFSSSLLNVLPEHVKTTANSRYIGQEEIEVKTLDTVLPEILHAGNHNIYMKIDTQGYSMEVLKGAEKTLPHIKGIQIELAATRLYEDEPLYLEMIQYLEDRNFHLEAIEPGHSDRKTGKMLQMDGIFYRE